MYNDRGWDYIQPILAFDMNMHVTPRVGSHDSWHFFRHSFAAFDLSDWDALRAIALAGKTRFTVKKKLIVFEGDTRTLGKPAEVNGFLLQAAGAANSKSVGRDSVEP
jgi:hypothetical protein